jgi:hypothetical protein
MHARAANGNRTADRAAIRYPPARAAPARTHFAPHIPATAAARHQVLFGGKPLSVRSRRFFRRRAKSKGFKLSQSYPAALPVSLKDAILTGNKQPTPVTATELRGMMTQKTGAASIPDRRHFRQMLLALAGVIALAPAPAAAEANDDSVTLRNAVQPALHAVRKLSLRPARRI